MSLVGTTDPNTTVLLQGLGLTTTSDQNGNFAFNSVNLQPGSNLLVAQATDVAGNTQDFTLSVQYLPPAKGDAVLQWNQITLNSILLSASDTVVASRALAMESIAVSDSIAAIEGTQAFLVHTSAPADASEAAAVAAAAHEILDTLNPSQRASLDAQYQASLAGIADGQGKTDGIALGIAVADQVIALRANDGSGATVVDDGGDNLGQWRPTGPNFGLAMDPQFANVTPFLMSSPGQFLSTVPPPPSLTSASYATDVNEVSSLGDIDSTTRTADQTQSARFWAGQDGTYTVVGQWNQIAAQAALQSGNSLAQDARLFAELDVGMADTGIATTNAKYNFNFWSPVTVLQNTDALGNPAIQANPNFTSLVTTPEAPEYVETQSAFSSAAAAILDKAFGSNVSFAATASNLAGVSRNFTSFDQAAQEAGRSGIYAGTDFQFSNAAGQNLGAQVGNLVLQSFDFTKTTNPPKIVLDQTNTNVVTNKNPVISGDVFGISANAAVLAASVDGGPATQVHFDQNGRFSLPTNFALNGSQDGPHTITLVASDLLGNQSNIATIHVTLDTQGPQIALAGLQNGSTIAAGTTLQGTALSHFAGLTGLSYSFDGGTAIPVAFDGPSTGAFNQALDLSQLATTGNHTLTITATDAAGNVTTQTLTVGLSQLIPLTVTALDFGGDASAVGVTFRPLITFSRPVDLSTLTNNSIFLTDAAGNRIATPVVAWTDNEHAWLFPDPTKGLPAGQVLTLHIDGSQIKGAADGAPLDVADSLSSMTPSPRQHRADSQHHDQRCHRGDRSGPSDRHQGPDADCRRHRLHPRPRGRSGHHRCAGPLHADQRAWRSRQGDHRRTHRHQCAGGRRVPRTHRERQRAAWAGQHDRGQPRAHRLAACQCGQFGPDPAAHHHRHADHDQPDRADDPAHHRQLLARAYRRAAPGVGSDRSARHAGR